MSKAIVGLFGARLDRGGLGSQTYAMARMLRPDKILAIDSGAFTKDAVQDYTRYQDFDCTTVNGFPSNLDCARFLRGITHLIACETTYNYNLLSLARQRGVKILLQPNPEFSDHLVNPRLPLPWHFILPSVWKQEEYTSRFNSVTVLPPPTIWQDFAGARDMNMARRGRKRFLHIVGRAASHDRNGTLSIIEALPYCKTDFELVVRSQFPLNTPFTDPRVLVDSMDHENQGELYAGFDAMIFPRRYAGLSLPCNEALMSALPVMMTDISPNNTLLDPSWLVPCEITDRFMTRIPIDVYNADPRKLAEKMDELALMDDDEMAEQKSRALDIGLQRFGADALRPKYEELLA